METIKAILQRRSIRQYAKKEIEEEKVNTILQAGMAGPSACNARPFEFIVVNDKELLAKMSDANGRAALLLKEAPLAIMVCMNMDKAYPRAQMYADVDCSIACQNMILAAYDLGIGSCWLGTYPQEEKQNKQKELFNLPTNIIPHSIIAFGYPADGVEFDNVKTKFEQEKVHYNRF